MMGAAGVTLSLDMPAAGLKEIAHFSALEAQCCDEAPFSLFLSLALRKHHVLSVLCYANQTLGCLTVF